MISRFLLISACLLIMELSFGQTTFDSIRCEHRISLLKKKALILKQLNLTESQKSSFWPIYESYELATEFVEAEYSFLLWQYARQFKSMNSKEQYEASAQMVEDEFLIARIRRQYFKRFRKAISAEQLTAFMQLDQSERTSFRMRLVYNTNADAITAARK